MQCPGFPRLAFYNLQYVWYRTFFYLLISSANLECAEAQSAGRQMAGDHSGGVCTFCNREFKVPLNAMKRVADAQESLRLQFTAHKCKTGAPPGPASGEQHP